MDSTVNPIDPNELRQLYYWAGLTLNASQTFEYGLKYLLWVLADRQLIDFAQDEATAIIEEQSKKTAGQVIRILTAHLTLAPEDEQAFREALNERNRFTHGFLTDKADEIADPASRNDVIREIKQIRKTLMRGDSVVRKLMPTLLALYGVAYDEFERQLYVEISSRNRNPTAGPQPE